MARDHTAVRAECQLHGCSRPRAADAGGERAWLRPCWAPPPVL